jgi:hypothetical protein
MRMKDVSHSIIFLMSRSMKKKNAQFSTSQREIVDSSSSKSESSFDSRRNSRLLSRLFEKSKQSISDEDENADSFKKKTIDLERRQRWLVVKTSSSSRFLIDFVW